MLSSKVKSLLRDRTAVDVDATIMMHALKETKLPSHTYFAAVGRGQSYRCNLYIASVFVACSEDAQKTSATGKAYMHAAELLQKPYLRLAVSCDSTTMLIGSDTPFEELQSTSRPEIDNSSQTIIKPIVH